jgi:hypothetical protein
MFNYQLQITMKRNLHLLSYLRAYKVFPTPVRRSYLRAYKAPNKTLFCSFFALFCTFCASLRLTRTVFSRPIRSLPTYQVGPCNPWLINDLRLFIALYNCRATFTNVMSALQIGPICSNKPNFRKSQMNVSGLIIREYEQMDTWSIRKNKPNSNPIQTQFKANQTQNKPNTNPNKPNTNPNKPNFILSLPTFQVGQYMLLRLTQCILSPAVFVCLKTENENIILSKRLLYDTRAFWRYRKCRT